MGLRAAVARWALKGANPKGWNISTWQDKQPYYPDYSQRALVAKYTGWVYACANRNAIAAARIPLRLYASKPTKNARSKFATCRVKDKQKAFMAESASLSRYVRKGVDVEEVLEHPFLELMAKVNPFTNGFELLEFLFLSQEITGECYWYLIYDNLGMPTEIYPLFSQYMKIIADQNNFIKEYIYSIGNITKQKISTEDIIHFKYQSLQNALHGMSPLEAGILAADLSQSMNLYETGLIKNRAHPDFAVVLPPEAGQPTESEQRRVETIWNKKYRGSSKGGKTAWLYGGLN